LEPQTARDATICVTTYKRPVGLARLLDAISRLDVPPGWDFDVVVVDNDPAGSARAVVESFLVESASSKSARGVNVRYVLEPERGISQVRNRAVSEATGTAWIAFLDDDEWPEPTWWRRLVDVQTASGADVVIGPSEPVFESDPPAWIREGKFFERERFPTGSVIPYWLARTSGVLIRRAAFAHLGAHPFDERCALSGGEDVRFFGMLDRQGTRIVWVDDAIVNELVPATRSNAGWLLRRAFRTGNSRGVTLQLEGAGIWPRVRRVVRGLLDVAIGIVRTIGATNDKAARMRGVTHSALGIGLIAGAVGVRYDEYSVTHGH
jgi:succinoglycan biosynthesis protein ExoM